MKKIKNNQQEIPQKHLYASPWTRLFARGFDFIFISIISFCFGLMAFINSKFTISNLFSPINNANVPYLEPWRVLIMVLISFFFVFFYFCIIPFLTKGYTLFKLLFRIRLWTKNQHKNFFWLIFKHEFLIWFFMMIFLLMFGILVVSLPVVEYQGKIQSPAILFSQFLFSFKGIDFSSNTPSWVYLYFSFATFIKSMLACSGMIPAVLLMIMFFRKNKLAPQDIVSETFVYYLNRFYEENAISNKDEVKKEVILPGMNFYNKEEKLSVEYQELLEISEKKVFDKLLSRQKELSKLKDDNES